MSKVEACARVVDEFLCRWDYLGYSLLIGALVGTCVGMVVGALMMWAWR